MAQRVTPTAWAGWIFFASAMLLLTGGMQIIAGLVAILNVDFYRATSAGLMVFNFTTYGWIDLALGVISMLAGIGLLAGATWARVYAVFVVVLAMLANLVFLTVFPLWSIVALIVNGFVLYALAVQGNEFAN